MGDDTTQTDCIHCGLPVPASRRGAGEAGRFCCFGCRLVYGLGRAGDDSSNAAAPVNTLLLRLGLGIFLAMNIMVFNWLFYSQHVYDVGDGSMQAEATASLLTGVFAWLQLLLCTLLFVLLGAPLLTDAIGTFELRRRVRIDVNLLILIGVFAAYALSTWHVFRGAGDLYFDTAAVILVLVTLGGYLDSRAKRRACADADALLTALPNRVWVQRGDEVTEIDAKEVRIGDVVRVRPGEAIPVDGAVTAGSSHVNEASLTGESQPRVAQAGDQVLAGAISVDGQLWVRATEIGAGRVIEQVRAVLADARRQKPAIQRVADRVAAVFVPGVVLLAVGVFAWRAADGDASVGLFAALSVLLISCPCALGLAAPLATWSALGRAARRGVLYRSAAALERAAAVGTLLFDKTGTLTTASPAIESIHTSDGMTETEALALAAAVESSCRHPIATAITEEAIRRELRIATATESRVVAGRGVEAVVDGRRLRIGNASLVRDVLGEAAVADRAHHADYARRAHHAQGEAATATNTACVYLIDDCVILATFALSEQLKPGAADAVRAWRHGGYHLRVLTGDQPGPAARLAERLGVEVEASLLPTEKLSRLRAIRAASRRPVAFIGDGINDAPALAAADVGFAVGGATDLARQAGDVTLMGHDLAQLTAALTIARDAMRRIRLNLLWAFGYNGVGIALAAAGLLNPMFAAAAMVGSSLMIVATSRNAGRLNDGDPNGEVTHPSGEAIDGERSDAPAVALVS